MPYKEGKSWTGQVKEQISINPYKYKVTRKKGFYTKGQASDWERNFHINKRIKPTYLFGEMFYEYIAQARVKETTKIKSIGIFKNYLQPIANKRIDTLTPVIINNLYSSLPDFSNKQYQAIHHVITSTVRYGNDFGLCDINLRIRPRANSDIAQPPLRFWTLEEYRAFRLVVDDEFLLLIFDFIYLTGICMGELRALTWNDLVDNKVTINKIVNILGKTTAPKTRNRYRTIDITTDLKQRLEALKTAMRMYDNFNNSWYIFSHKGYYPLSRNAIQKAMLRLIPLTDVPPITPHGLRHSHASFLYNEGEDYKFIAERLGNTENMVRQTYSHIFGVRRQSITDKLEKVKF